MREKSIANYYRTCSQTERIVKKLLRGESSFQMVNLVGSSLSFVLSEIFKKVPKTQVLLFPNKEVAAYYGNDLESLLGGKQVLFFPSSYQKLPSIDKTDRTHILLRSEVLTRLRSDKKPIVVVTYPEALFEKVVSPKEIAEKMLKVSVSDTLSLSFVNELLFEYRFKRVDFVTEPGEFSVRGGLIDLFSFSKDMPYRIEFFGEEVESIRTFDIETQLSKEKVEEAFIVPNIEDKTLLENRISFLEYISAKTVVFTQDTEMLFRKLDTLYEKVAPLLQETSPIGEETALEALFCSGELIKAQLDRCTKVSINQPVKKGVPCISYQTKAQPPFNKQFDFLLKNLQDFSKQGYQNYIFCANEKQGQRFDDIFKDIGQEVPYTTLVFPMYQGFVDTEAKMVCYTDHQIFERYYKYRLKDGYTKKKSISVKELTRLKIGDYVTHIDHGIGKFGGLQKIDVQGHQQEAIKLLYGDRDVLYISIHSLHKIAKFNGKDGKVPKVYKLGSATWKKIKQKTKASAKHIAFNLITLYAKRKVQKGFSFRPDTHMQHELEASFMYEDTPDQWKATREVKADMEKEQPMDRLICGDVGFGKTEVAIRAAFKAVDNGKQVAVLVPTTILAFQHFKTFSKRLKNFPVTVDYLNRFRSSKEKKNVLEGLAKGSVDIVIGTHQLTHNKISFKDLGLLIIDEEQKFGVAVKDKLKTIKENVDTLTLTATPIPRTLQFSLTAARDLSIIRTPPPNRYPIETQGIRFHEETIREAILYEISRGGQVFFIHNRIENIQEVATLLQKLVPETSIEVGHGQMEGKKLEELLLRFLRNEFDVLVSTTIVESGLDVPNANTIFIHQAHHFGLSDLHQMRGRVGRSNKKAFCFLITPPYSTMTDEARKRIEVLELFSDLGSGLHIAMKDLEIRGAGDLLGGEQSGFINEIGFDTYQKILNEAVAELKEKEVKAFYPSDSSEPKTFVSEVQMDTDFEILFPDAYINIISERLSLYTELGTLQTEEELLVFENKIVDRFGKIPKPVIDLLDSVRIKWLAKKIGFERIVLKKKRMIGYFVSDPQSPFYQTSSFTRMLAYVQKNGKSCVIKEKETKEERRLLLTFIHIDSVAKALAVLKDVEGSTA